MMNPSSRAGSSEARGSGADWADRFPAIVDAAQCLKAQSFLIDGEAVIASDDGTSVTGSVIPTVSIASGDRALFTVDGLGEVAMEVF